jgi:uncharacterized protein YgiM (DUF1202 family)
MKANLRRIALGILLLVSCSGGVRTREATAKRNLVVRRDPSKSSPILARLAKDDRLTLVQATANNGYYNVKTEQDVIGWALATSVDVSQPQSLRQPRPSNLRRAANATTSCEAMCTTRIVSSLIRSAFLQPEPSWTRPTAKNLMVSVTKRTGTLIGWLKVDSQFQTLNAGNNSNEGGNLAFEVICKYKVTQADARAACSNYQNQVSLPPVGSHVRIVGVCVQDTFHA